MRMRNAASFLVLEAESLAPGDERAAQTLERLGCDVDVRSLRDVIVAGGRHDASISMVLIEALDEVDDAYRALDSLNEAGLENIPKVLAITTQGLSRVRVRDVFDEVVLFPYVPAELYLRLRRLEWRSAAFVSANQVKFGRVHLDSERHEVKVDGRMVELTLREFRLLEYLMRHPNRVFERAHLLRTLWAQSFVAGTRTVDIHIRRLRQKLGEDIPLETVRGLGYRFRSDER